jgi:hypothetical protein
VSALWPGLLKSYTATCWYLQCDTCNARNQMPVSVLYKNDQVWCIVSQLLVPDVPQIRNACGQAPVSMQLCRD